MGAACARKLADDGYSVGILSSSGKGEALGAALGGFGVTGSNQDAGAIKALVDGAMARWGRVDVLVNSAGHGPRGARQPRAVVARQHRRGLAGAHGDDQQDAGPGQTRGPAGGSGEGVALCLALVRCAESAAGEAAV